jgi:hypothetical protein
MEMFYIVLLVFFGLLFLVAELVLLPGVSIGAVLALVCYGSSVYLAFRDFGPVTGTVVILVILVLSVIATVVSLRAKTWQRFSLKQELANPEMRRLMELPGMRMGDAYRLAHYNDALRQTAQTVEQGVVERIRQRSARPAENGTSPGGAAITRADVASMTRAQREALERRAMHGVKISF